ncbi:MAG: nitrogenase component 1 [Eubacteriales bacterium]|nr:nitrogenase component 1 [Eubacteriales bacterium]
MNDYQTHVFTSTYTADVSGVCSAMYELGGMTVLHDPSGCNSTYSTHDEPRWFDGKSLMFVSGLDEMTAVLGDDQVLIRDIADAAEDFHPRFITLCGGSIPHVIAFDYKGCARLIEDGCGVPVLPVKTDGMKSYVSGVGRALTEFIRKFADPKEQEEGKKSLSVNLLGVTPLDFSINGNAEALRESFEEAGIRVNCCAAMGETFEGLSHIYRGSVNVVVSSAGRRPARYMERTAGIPRVEGLPVGAFAEETLIREVRSAYLDRKNRMIWDESDSSDEKTDFSVEDLEGGFSGENALTIPEGQILILGEEVYAKSLAMAVNHLPESLREGKKAYAFFPDIDEGIPEAVLIPQVRSCSVLISDPLYRVVMKPGQNTRFAAMPHEAYSGRIYRDSMRKFVGKSFDVEEFLRSAE